MRMSGGRTEVRGYWLRPSEPRTEVRGQVAEVGGRAAEGRRCAVGERWSGGFAL